MDKGKIILLNGVSSAGKTTLAKCMQERAEAELVWLSVDTFCHMWPDKVFRGDFGETFLKIQDVMGLTIKLFADRGVCVVVDVVLLEPFHSLEVLTALLADYSVLFVQVACPPEELRRREIARGDREQGQAEGQLAYLVPQNEYDLTVDTFHASTENCADEILRLFARPQQWTAFKKLCQGASKGVGESPCPDGPEF